VSPALAAGAGDASQSGIGDVWPSVLIMAAVLVLAYVGMWRGWHHRIRRHDVPPLAPVPEGGAETLLASGGRYIGTTVSGDWLDRVLAQGLGVRAECRLELSDDGLDVLRARGPFRIPTTALRGARHDQGIAGKVMPPHGLLVVTWQHGDLLLDSGFRLTDFAEPGDDMASQGSDRSVTEAHDRWIQTISKLAKENTQ
jgi:hypothetical protein